MISAVSAAESCPEKAVPEGFISLFDGKTLDGWDADPQFWRVEDGSIVGESTPEKKVAHNSSLILRKVASPRNFEIYVDFKMSRGANSGLSFRASETEGKPWNILGHHADIFDHDRHMGTFYFGGVQAWRGQKVFVGPDRKPTVTENFASPEELMAKIDRYGWNTFHLIVRENTYILYINDVKMAEVEESPLLPQAAGVLGFQMHAGPAMKIQYKNIFFRIHTDST